MLYFKKVDAVEFRLTEADKEAIRNKKPVYFEGSPVKHVGGNTYVALLKRGEDLLKIYNDQWLVKHPDGMLQIIWPHEFARNFQKADLPDSEPLLTS